MADLSTLEIIKASEKPTAEDFSYIYAESGNKAFIRIAKDKLKEIINEGNYTNEEIDQKISSIPKFNIEVVSSLPTTDISETTIYLVSSGDDSENLYTEYININGLWEILGTQKASFSGSAKDVTYDDTETNLGATNVQGAIGKLSQTVNDMKENGTGTGEGISSIIKQAIATVLDAVLIDTNKQASASEALAKIKAWAYGGTTEVIVSQTGSVLTLSNVTDITSITQTGTTLALA